MGECVIVDVKGRALATRIIWPPPSDATLSSELELLDMTSKDLRIKRLRFLHEEFGPPKDMVLMGGTPGYLAMTDMGITFLNGAFMSTIMAAHIFVEQSLGASLIIVGDDKEAESSLGRIISKSLENGAINEHIALRLTELKNIRIAYFHTHIGTKKRSFLGRFLESDHFDIERFIEDDAKQAIRIVVDLIRHQNPGTLNEIGAKEDPGAHQYTLFDMSK